jgi:hypothetical protein
MEHIRYDDTCEIIEPIIPGQELAIPYVNGASGNSGQIIELNVTTEQINQGMLIITTKRTSDAVNDVTLVYPNKYVINNGQNMRSLIMGQYIDIFSAVPLLSMELKEIYKRAIENHDTDAWRGVMSFDGGLLAPQYDYKLYVYLFPKWT